ncbi:transposase [Paraburkholderia sprentiae WSM5005]|uniref:Transposase n=1 Tax=Paraburkholderia sprentiae WSM5005 TaxID=754502 RepID=A0A8F4KJQ9_9BURK|nr:transposase [Paraburkholderia sprentiae WSM5005]
MHLSIDAEMNVHAIAITGTDVSDIEGMDRVLPDDIPIDRVTADGAYYSIERTEALSRSGVLPVISPPSHAVVHGEEQTQWHDKVVGYIKEKRAFMRSTRSMAMGNARWSKRRSRGSNDVSVRPC